MRYLSKFGSYLPLILALGFASLATLCLHNNQIGTGLTNLIFALYFTFDFKVAELRRRIQGLENSGQSVSDNMAKTNQRIIEVLNNFNSDKK